MSETITESEVEIIEFISTWIKEISEFPGFREWKRKSLAKILHDDDTPDGASSNHAREFLFPPHIEARHKAVYSFLAMHTTWHALADCEYYIRRYPFSIFPSRKKNIYAMSLKCISAESMNSANG